MHGAAGSRHPTGGELTEVDWESAGASTCIRIPIELNSVLYKLRGMNTNKPARRKENTNSIRYGRLLRAVVGCTTVHAGSG